jgi:dihydroxy-acid dehydratase
MAAFKPTGAGEKRGVLGKYAATVATASEGAVTDKNL